MFKEISVPDLYGDFNSSDSWYVHNLYLSENFVSKEYLELKKVHNNVRKWPNLRCIGLGMFGKLIVKLNWHGRWLESLGRSISFETFSG